MNGLDKLIILCLIIILINKIINLNKSSEKFTVADANDFKNYPKLLAEAREETNTFEDDTINFKGTTFVPPTYTSPLDVKINTKAIKCQNHSIANKWKSNKTSLTANRRFCQTEDIIPRLYYKKYFQPQIAQLDDPIMQGYNYMDFSDNVSPVNSAKLRLISPTTGGLPKKDNQYKNIPIGSNYAFNNSPARSNNIR